MYFSIYTTKKKMIREKIICIFRFKFQSFVNFPRWLFDFCYQRCAQANSKTIKRKEESKLKIWSIYMRYWCIGKWKHHVLIGLINWYEKVFAKRKPLSRAATKRKEGPKKICKLYRTRIYTYMVYLRIYIWYATIVLFVAMGCVLKTEHFCIYCAAPRVVRLENWNYSKLLIFVGGGKNLVFFVCKQRKIAYNFVHYYLI